MIRRQSMKEWLKNAVFYEIYPQSFKDTNGDGIGDINGIIEKLDYIKETGFNAILVHPMYLSPFMDAGYDAEDFYTIAPRYGTNADAKRLFDEVHKRGMHIFTVLIPCHTAITSKEFKESCKAEKNKYSGRFLWTPNHEITFDGVGGVVNSMRGMSERDGCFGTSYYSIQPAINYGIANPTADWQDTVDSENARQSREELINIMRFWLDMGCDGFRVDMASAVIKNDNDKSEAIKFWQKVFGIINKEYPEAAFVPEWGDPTKSSASGFDTDFCAFYYKLFRVWDNDGPYFSHTPQVGIKDFFDIYMTHYKEVFGKSYMSVITGNHDTPRISRLLDDTELKLAYAFLMAMPGIPFVYYGDEIGMKYLADVKSIEGGYERTGSRSPMQWDSSKNCGFSTADADKLYMMIDPDENRPTVEAQQKDPNSLYNTVKKLLSIRMANEELQSDAEIELVYIVESTYPCIFKRKGKDRDILIVINANDNEQSCDFDGELGEALYEYNGKAVCRDGKIIVPPCSASYFVLK